MGEPQRRREFLPAASDGVESIVSKVWLRLSLRHCEHGATFARKWLKLEDDTAN